MVLELEVSVGSRVKEQSDISKEQMVAYSRVEKSRVVLFSVILPN